MKNLNRIPRLKMLALTLMFAAGFFVHTDQIVGQQTIADTPAAKRYVQFLAIMNEANEEKRNQLIRENVDLPASELEQIFKQAKSMNAQVGSLTFERETTNDKTHYGGICLTKSGMKLTAIVEIGGDKNMIKDVSVEETEQGLKAVGDLIPILTDGKSAPKARGVWHAEGYGYLLEVTENELKAYNYSGNFGWQFEFVDNLLFKPPTADSKAKATFSSIEPGFTLTKLEKLPEVCRKTEWTSTELFDAFADIMTTHYAFFKERNIDWQARIKEHRPKVKDGMPESELFAVMAAMLKDLHDGHVGLKAEIDGEDHDANIGRKGTSLKLMNAYMNQDEIKSKDDFGSVFVKNLDTSITKDALKGEFESACNDKLTWGRVHEKIGYIRISAMYQFGSGDFAQRLESMHAAMNKILTELADTEALIIDISMNPGGSDLISTGLASHFADKRRLCYSKWPAAVKEYRNDFYVEPFSETNKNGVNYTKPIFLLQNDESASAAEIFTMSMRPFPHVVTVGQPTEGVLSDVLSKPLPNGWEFQISNEVYIDHEGVCHEGPGIPPQIKMEVFGDDIMNHDHAAVLNKIVAMALKKAQK